MGHAHEAGLRLRRACDDLAERAQIAGVTHPEIISFARELIAHLIRADGSTGGEELSLQIGFNREDGYSWQEEADHARYLANANPRFLRTIPSFIQRAKDYDDRHGTVIAAALVAGIAKMCTTIRAIDGQAHPDELANGAVLLATLRTAIDADD